MKLPLSLYRAYGTLEPTVYETVVRTCSTYGTLNQALIIRLNSAKYSTLETRGS